MEPIKHFKENMILYYTIICNYFVAKLILYDPLIFLEVSTFYFPEIFNQLLF